jgi:hypothetical protein
MRPPAKSRKFALRPSAPPKILTADQLVQVVVGLGRKMFAKKNQQTDKKIFIQHDPNGMEVSADVVDLLEDVERTIIMKMNSIAHKNFFLVLNTAGYWLPETRRSNFRLFSRCFFINAKLHIFLFFYSVKNRKTNAQKEYAFW